MPSNDTIFRLLAYIEWKSGCLGSKYQEAFPCYSPQVCFKGDVAISRKQFGNSICLYYRRLSQLYNGPYGYATNY